MFLEKANFWPEWAVIAGLVVIAAGIRLLYLSEWGATPYYDNPVIDGAAYLAWAKDIAYRSFIGEDVFFQDPLYPYFLAVLIKIFGVNFTAFYLVQIALGCLGVVLVYLLARETFDRRVAVFAGLAAALYRMFVFYDVMLIKTFMGLVLIDAALLFLLYAMKKRRGYVWLLAGIFLGLAWLVRGNFMLLVPVFLLWIYIYTRKEKRRFWKRALPLLAGVFLAIAPVTIRNYAVSNGDFVLTTSHVGLNVWIGNNPANKTGAYEVPREVRAAPKWEKADFKRIAEKETGRQMKDSEVTWHFLGKAGAFALENTGDFLALTSKKFALFLDDYEVADNHSVYFMKKHSWTLTALPVSFGMLLALAVLGFGLSLSRKRMLLYFFIGGYASTVIMTFVFARYRAPILGVLAVFAAAGIVRSLDLVKQKMASRLFWPALAAMLVMAFSFFPVYPSSERERDLAVRWRNLGVTHLARAEYARATSAFEEFKNLTPDKADGYYWLARVNYERGGPVYGARAWDYARQAVRIDGSWPAARLLLGKILLQKGNYFGAVGEFALIASRSDEAGQLIGKVEQRLKDTAFFEEELKKNSDDPWVNAFFALSLVFNGREQAGVAMLVNLHEEHPWQYEFVEQNLLHALLTIGMREEAMALAAEMADHDIFPYRVDIPILEGKE